MVLVLTYAAIQTDQGKKKCDLVVEQEKRPGGVSLDDGGCDELLDAKEKTSNEKEITTEKEKKGTNSPSS